MQTFALFTGQIVSRTYNRLCGLAIQQHGSTAVEYALMVGVLAGIMLSSIKAVGTASTTTFMQIAQSLDETEEMAPQACEIEAPTAVSIPAPMQAP
ncbi:MAG: hypothetical protein J0M26_13025 [Planctomycetes bacterium]|nr:hypothetical protein [Planctomycetota bacterium]